MPEAEVAAQPLTPEQQARRLRLRRAVSGVVLGLFAFTALATCLYLSRGRDAASNDAEIAAKPVPEASRASERSQAASPAPAAVTTAPLSETDQALALAQDPVATVENLQAWSRLAAQLSPADRQRVEHDLSLLSVKGPRSVQEAARLELALLWRATARRAKAQKVLVSLARTARDPLVKKYALDTLRSV
jgi:hypothetical protein